MSNIAKTAEQVSSIMEISSIEIYGDLPPEIKQALAAYSPTYYSFVAGLEG